MRFPISSAVLVAAVLATGASVIGCLVEPVEDEQADSRDDALAKSATAHWFYGGPLPRLDSPAIIVSLDGHTVRISGLLPDGAMIPELPHVKTSSVSGSDDVRVDVVYPIATARTYDGKSDSTPGKYSMSSVRPYRPDGNAWTPKEGTHWVTWGGFPFLPYNGGIALHGPITDTKSGDGIMDTWFLRRGDVSGGCNRMMGEHVVELAHIIGVGMRSIYKANTPVTMASKVPVTVVAGYDSYDGQLIDVDYPTDIHAVRPKGDVAMFGSWVASETPDGKDLPPDMKWEGGVNGQWYTFAEHARQNWVCSALPKDLPALRAWALARTGVDAANDERAGELPADFCQVRTCVLGQLGTGGDPESCLGE
jgi:hypothetical protein